MKYHWRWHLRKVRLSEIDQIINGLLGLRFERRNAR